MKFFKCADWQAGADQLHQRLSLELAGAKQVLWLLSGGSNLPVAAAVMRRLSPEHSRNLHLLLGDERYGEPGHADSNWAQLLEAGFDPQLATVYPVLTSQAFSETIAHYRQQAAGAFAAADVVIGQLGIGADGHIAGILPGSEAAAATDELVVGYRSQPYDRLTLSFAGLQQIDIAFVFAFGDNKRQPLETLASGEFPLVEQPSQVLRSLPAAYIYNDQAGESI